MGCWLVSDVDLSDVDLVSDVDDLLVLMFAPFISGCEKIDHTWLLITRRRRSGRCRQAWLGIKLSLSFCLLTEWPDKTHLWNKFKMAKLNDKPLIYKTTFYERSQYGTKWHAINLLETHLAWWIHCSGCYGFHYSFDDVEWRESYTLREVEESAKTLMMSIHFVAWDRPLLVNQWHFESDNSATWSTLLIDAFTHVSRLLFRWVL